MFVTEELAELLAEQVEEMVAEWPTPTRAQARRVLPRLLTYEGDDALLRGWARAVVAGGQMKVSQLAIAAERLP
jgi:hypothetical protein